jgi:hypothetical protein
LPLPPRRHTKTCKLLNCASSISLKNRLTELAECAKTHNSKATDLFEKALKELKKSVLTSQQQLKLKPNAHSMTSSF